MLMSSSSPQRVIRIRLRIIVGFSHSVELFVLLGGCDVAFMLSLDNIVGRRRRRRRRRKETGYESNPDLWASGLYFIKFSAKKYPNFIS